MLIAGKDTEVVKAFAKELSQKLKVTCGDVPSSTSMVLIFYKHVKALELIVLTYIEKLRKAHGWNDVSNKPLVAYQSRKG
jgi:hypothetical protein